MVHVIALKDHNPDGNKMRKKGARYTIGERAASLLARLGYVRIEPSEPKVKTYSRRDMRAED